MHLDHVYSINLEKATAWPFPHSQGLADLVKRKHWALKEFHNKENTTAIYRNFQGVQTPIKIKSMA